MQSICEGAALRAPGGYKGSAKELNNSHRRDACPEEQMQPGKCFAACEQGQERSEESSLCGLQRELWGRDATPNVTQMGDNLPTHSYLVFF